MLKNADREKRPCWHVEARAIIANELDVAHQTLMLRWLTEVLCEDVGAESDRSKPTRNSRLNGHELAFGHRSRCVRRAANRAANPSTNPSTNSSIRHHNRHHRLFDDLIKPHPRTKCAGTERDQQQ